MVLAEYKRTGLSAVPFAKVVGLKYSTVAGWLQRYRGAKPKGTANPVCLFEAVVAPPEPSALLVPSGS